MKETQIDIHKSLTSAEIEGLPLLKGNSEASGEDHRTPESYVREWRVACENEEFFVGNRPLELPEVTNDDASYKSNIKTYLIDALEQVKTNIDFSDELIDSIYKGMTQGGFVHWGTNYLASQIPTIYRPANVKKRFNIVISDDQKSIQIIFTYVSDLQPVAQKDIEFRHQLETLKNNIEHNTPASLTTSARKLLDTQQAQRLASISEKAKTDKQAAVKEIESLLALPTFSSEVVYSVNLDGTPQPKTIACKYSISNILESNIIDLLIAQKENISTKLPDRIWQQNLFNEKLFTILENSDYSSGLNIVKQLLSKKIITLEEIAFNFQKNINLKATIEKALSDQNADKSFSIRIPTPDLDLLLGALQSLPNSHTTYYSSIVNYRNARNFQPDVSVLRKLHEVSVFLTNALPDNHLLKSSIIEKTQSWEKKLVSPDAQELRRIAANSLLIEKPTQASSNYAGITAKVAAAYNASKHKAIVMIVADESQKKFDPTKHNDIKTLAMADKTGKLLAKLINDASKKQPAATGFRKFLERFFPKFFKPKKDLLLEQKQLAINEVSYEDYLKILQTAEDSNYRSTIESAPVYVNENAKIEESYQRLKAYFENSELKSNVNYQVDFIRILNLSEYSSDLKQKAEILIKKLCHPNNKDFAKIEKFQDPELIGLVFKHPKLIALLSDNELSKIREIAAEIHAPIYRIDQEIRSRQIRSSTFLSQEEAIQHLESIKEAANKARDFIHNSEFTSSQANSAEVNSPTKNVVDQKPSLTFARNIRKLNLE